MKKSSLNELMCKVKPYWGVFYFAAMLLITHYAWKYSFSESLQMGGAPQIWLWQTFDCSAFFDKCVDYVCAAINWVFSDVFGVDGYQIYGHRFYILEPVRYVIGIVWSCTGLKQLFIFTMMLLLYPRGHKQKIWAIPAFGVLVLLLNLIRLMVLFYHVKQVPADFDLWHEGSKYVFYAVLFGLWIFWENIVNKYASRS